MADPTDDIRRHYGVPGLTDRIVQQLASHGISLDNLTRDHLAAFDEFHAGGRDMTRTLARAADLRPGLDILDIGCGIGGPARTLAADFGCRIVGLDPTEEFIAAARMLTDRVGLADCIQFTTGYADYLPFPDRRFDIVWFQFVLPNVPYKDRMVAEIRRVLKPGGRLAFHDVMKGAGDDLAYPTFWADSPSMSFLETPEDFERRLDQAGFIQLFYRNYTVPSLEWYRAAAQSRKQPRATEPLATKPHSTEPHAVEQGAVEQVAVEPGAIEPRATEPRATEPRATQPNAAPSAPKPLGLGVIVPEDAKTKSMNVMKNLETGRIKIFLGAFQLPA